MTKKETITISIPEELVEKLNKRIESTDFDSVSSYVIYILNQVLANIEETENSSKPDETSDEQQKKVQERLKRLESLGYLD